MAVLITNIGELVTNDLERNDPAGDGSTGDHSVGDDLLGIVRDAGLVIDGNRVAWVGPAAKAPAADELVDAGGRAVLPGFVDSHSHLVFAGDRAQEFAAR